MDKEGQRSRSSAFEICMRMKKLLAKKKGMDKEEMKEEMKEESGKKAVITGTHSSESIWRFPEQGNIPRARKRVIPPVTSESLSRLEDQDEQLFPGLSNEIVLDQIVPKIPWRAFHILASVSHSWRQAIQSHQVFDARVRSHSTETLLLMNFAHSSEDSITGMGIHAICLYYAREKTWHRLPVFRHKRMKYTKGLPIGCGCVSLDGKVYVLGGQEDQDWRKDFREVYVLDLAGQTGWSQCANMLNPRTNFAYGIIDGKIYVVGGTSRGKTTRTSEVYDPKENAWSSIRPLVSKRLDPEFVTVGKELWVYGGTFYDKDYNKTRLLSDEVYRPSKGEWELIKPFKCSYKEGLFTMQGKLYHIAPDGICVYDCNDGEHSWTRLHSFSYSEVESTEDFWVEPIAACAVKDEVLALVSFKKWPMDETALLQSKGFGKEIDQIVWEKLFHPFSGEDPYEGSPTGQHFMCPVQL